MTQPKPSLGLAALLALLALFALLPVAAAKPRAQETKAVTIQNFAFEPLAVSINVGDSVTWTNNDTAPHTATASDKSFDSGRLDQGQSFSFTFTQAGTFQYVCTFHDRMPAGTIEVKEVAAAPAAQPAAPAAPAVQPATPTGSVEVADQAVANRTIRVAKVVAGQDGWIVAHLDEGGQPGRVLGQTAVKAGTSENVQITLSEDVPVGGALWPMLHIDAGTLGTYEFPGADVPVRAGNDIVMAKFTVTAAGAAPAAGSAPAALPRTAGAEQPIAALFVALLLLLAGAMARTRRA
jgi:plastocyanin